MERSEPRAGPADPRGGAPDRSGRGPSAPSGGWRRLAWSMWTTASRSPSGKRLVTTGVALRRWDGFVSLSGGRRRRTHCSRKSPRRARARAATLDAAVAAELAGVTPPRGSQTHRAAAEAARQQAAAAERAARDSIVRGICPSRARTPRRPARTIGDRARDIEPLALAAADALASAEATAAALADPKALWDKGCAARTWRAALAKRSPSARCFTRERAKTAADRERTRRRARGERVAGAGGAAQKRLADAAQRQASLATNAPMADQPVEQATKSKSSNANGGRAKARSDQRAPNATRAAVAIAARRSPPPRSVRRRARIPCRAAAAPKPQVSGARNMPDQRRALRMPAALVPERAGSTAR